MVGWFKWEEDSTNDCHVTGTFLRFTLRKVPFIVKENPTFMLLVEKGIMCMLEMVQKTGKWIKKQTNKKCLELSSLLEALTHSICPEDKWVPFSWWIACSATLLLTQGRHAGLLGFVILTLSTYHWLLCCQGSIYEVK